MEIPIDMAFIPRGTWIFNALCNQLVRGDLWTSVVFSAIGGRRERGITTGIGGRRPIERGETGGWIELGKAVERAVGEAVGLPVSTKCAEVVIEAAVFLRHENDMVQNLHRLIDVEGCGDGLIRVHRQGAGCGAFTGAGPSREEGACGRCGGKFHAGAGGEGRFAGGWASDARGAAGDGSGGSASQRHC